MATLTGPAFTTTNTLDAQRGHLIAKEQKSRDGTLLARYAHAVNTLGQREQVSATRGVSTSPCRCQVAQPCQKMTTDPVSPSETTVIQHRLMTTGARYFGDYRDNKRFGGDEASTIEKSDFYVPIH